jgi:hypothetical protein
MFILLLIFSICEGTEFNPLDTLKVHENSSFWEKVSFGIGYEGGLCYTGEDLLSNSSGQWIRNPFYRMNSLEANIWYKFNPRYAIGVGSGYMWATLKDRSGSLYIPHSPTESGWVHLSTDWEIMAIPIILVVKRTFSPNVTPKFCILEINYYLSKGEDTEKASQAQSGGEEVIRTVPVTIQGRGLGGAFTVGVEKSFLQQWKGYFSLTLRIGMATEYENNAPEDVVWKGPITFNFSGLYINVGIEY